MPKIWHQSWLWGDKSKIADKAGISSSYLSDIIANRRPCSGELATTLAAVCKEFGYLIPRRQWTFPDLRTNNPLFDIDKGEV